MERTLVLVKPDGVGRRLVGAILSRFEAKGLRVAGLKLLRPPRETIERLYEPHRGKPFYPSLLEFMSGGPVVAAVLEGPAAIGIVRTLLGSTRASEAAPGTIRGDLGISSRFNLVHGSDSTGSAEREIAIFFSPGELERYPLPDEGWFLD